MANQRSTFAKRQREQNRNEKARAKQARLAARRAETPGTKGPPIAPFETVDTDSDADAASDDSATDQPPAARTGEAPGD
jgi:hypothetical protein